MSIREIDYEQDIKSIEYIWLKHCNSYKEQKWEDVDGEIKCPKNRTYVKIKNDSIVAFITIRIENVEDDDNLQNYTFELFAYPKRKGFGSELLKEMQDKRQFLILHVKKTSTDAIKCYKKNGFQINEENQDGSKYRMVWRNKDYN